MSKKAKAREKRKKLTAKAQSRNHQRHLQYEKFSTTENTPSVAGSNGELAHTGKSKGRYSGTGHTKAQKKRLANGKPAEGYTASYHPPRNFGSLTYDSGGLW